MSRPQILHIDESLETNFRNTFEYLVIIQQRKLEIADYVLRYLLPFVYACIAASVSPALNATFPSSFNAVTFWVAGFGSGSALPEDDSFLSPIVTSQLIKLKNTYECHLNNHG